MQVMLDIDEDANDAALVGLDGSFLVTLVDTGVMTMISSEGRETKEGLPCSCGGWLS